MNFLSKLKQGLTKTRNQISSIISYGSSKIGDDFFELIEDALISADVGCEQTSELIDILKKEISEKKIDNAKDAYDLLKSIIARGLSVIKFPDYFPPKPWIILVVGVNGVGKTTTIGKLALEYKNKNKKVMLAAADTFRAGAIEQLKIWAQKTNSEIVAKQQGADPASVAYDALSASIARQIDVLILDTAGRLHTKVNLINELQKIVKTLQKLSPSAPNEILMVVDATTGQNAIKQVEVFNNALGITGFIITKLDGTAKGGIAVALTKKFGIPIRKIGIGEQPEDLQDFSPQAFVDAMLGEYKE
jgi:fused signal recognition particle receptor